MKKPGQLPKISTLSAQKCWRAVLARDARQDGRFVYAVRSTGIYCRPSCPSRRPRRAQALFFARPETAEREGFRPCRRCQPQVAVTSSSGKFPLTSFKADEASAQAEMVQRVCRHMEANLDGPLRLTTLAAPAGVGPLRLQRVFQRVMGITPRQYADARRLELLKRRLQEGQDVTTAMYEAGYGSSSRLYERAPAQLGMTPATYRRGGQGMRIGYTIVDSPLGRLLVAATERGISAVSLGDSDAKIEAALSREYPNAEIRRDTDGLRHWVRALVSHLRGHQPHLDLPLDVQATAFQRRVWEALRGIPYGATRSYSQIARAIGRPKASRAVARACATNPVSVVIPCHRVVREDGHMGGYRWGLERKRALLERESAVARQQRRKPLQERARRRIRPEAGKRAANPGA